MPTPPAPPAGERPVRLRTAAAALFLVAAVLNSAFLLQPLVGSRLDPLSTYINELAALNEPARAVFALGDAALALVLTLAALLAWWQFGPRGWLRTARTALLWYAAMSAIDSVLPLDCAPGVSPGCLAEPLALADVVHSISGVVETLAVIAACYSLGLAVRGYPDWETLSLWGRICGSAQVALALIVTALWATDSPGTGLGQRASTALFSLTLVVLAGFLARHEWPRRPVVDWLEPAAESYEVIELGLPPEATLAGATKDSTTMDSVASSSVASSSVASSSATRGDGYGSRLTGPDTDPTHAGIASTGPAGPVDPGTSPGALLSAGHARATMRVEIHPARAAQPVTTVLFCNGLTLPLELWYPVIRELPEFRCVAYDRPGLGGSRGRAGADLLAQIAQLRAVVEAIAEQHPDQDPRPDSRFAGAASRSTQDRRSAPVSGPLAATEHQPTNRLVLVGHSHGAIVAEAFTRVHPGLVDALLLVDPSLPGSPPDPGPAYELELVRQAAGNDSPDRGPDGAGEAPLGKRSGAGGPRSRAASRIWDGVARDADQEAGDGRPRDETDHLPEDPDRPLWFRVVDDLIGWPWYATHIGPLMGRMQIAAGSATSDSRLPDSRFRRHLSNPRHLQACWAELIQEPIDRWQALELAAQLDLPDIPIRVMSGARGGWPLYQPQRRWVMKLRERAAELGAPDPLELESAHLMMLDTPNEVAREIAALSRIGA